MYKIFIRPLFFLFSPERAHYWAMTLLKIACKLPGIKYLLRAIFSFKNTKIKQHIAGLDFANPVGLAAGLDKNADYMHELSVFGFGFIEVGTVTPLPQPGNPKPRLFRLKKDHALINRMGFNNKGIDHMVKRLANKPKGLVIGVNIGKNKVTPNDQAAMDYEICINKLQGLADYFVINVSSPNTPGLRALQKKASLKKILSHVQKANKMATPVFLKMAPDIDKADFEDMLLLAREYQLSGIIISNTSISRKGLKTAVQEVKKAGSGGLSGTKELAYQSDKLLRIAQKQANGKLILIGVGGIHTAEDAKRKLDAGAALIQLYTGFIYQGPSLVKRINRSLCKRINE